MSAIDMKSENESVVDTQAGAAPSEVRVGRLVIRIRTNLKAGTCTTSCTTKCSKPCTTKCTTKPVVTAKRS